MLKKIIHKLVLTCKEATLLMELQDSNAISYWQRKRLLIHVKICKYCRIYRSKKLLITNYFLRIEDIEQNKEEDTLKINGLKERINQQIINKENG